MSEKNDYWRELFGDDFPDELADELGISGQQGKQSNSNGRVAAPVDNNQYRDELFNLDDDSQWFSVDQETFDAPKGHEDSLSSDTNIIPDSKTLSDIVSSGSMGKIKGVRPIYDEEDIVPEDSEYITDRDIDNEPEEYFDEDEEQSGGSKRTGFMGGLMYAGFVVCVALILACLLWLAAGDILALNKDETEATVTVSEEWTIDEVASTLKENGIIEYKTLFKLFAWVYNADEKIQSGAYTLSTDYDYRALISTMSSSSSTLVSVQVVIPEGKTMEEIFRILEENEVCDYDSLVDAATNYNFNYSFLDDSTLGDASRLEGYLFPDTYDIYKNISASTALDKLLSNFNDKMKEYSIYDLEQDEDNLYDILTIASMIQGEAAEADEMATISSVIHNRLNIGKELEIDATIQYVLEDRVENLTDKELAIDDPYNTYMYKGLPPTPICNPGIEAIKAALEPADTNYYYYALSTSGRHEFFTDYDSHNAFVHSSEFAYYEG